MAPESVGSYVGFPPPASGYPTSPFLEERNYSPNAPAASPKVLFPKCPQYPELPCKVCGDPCVVRTSHTERNPNRDFYTCASGKKCNMFLWCDEAGKIGLRGVNSPVKQNIPVKYNSPTKPGLQHDVAASQNPICTCGAGPCRVETKQNGEFKGRKYFACHLKKGQGLCIHFEWCDGRGETKGKNVIIPDETDEIVAPDLVEGSPSKRKRVEGRLNECIASPTLGYIDKKQPMDWEIGPGESRVKESPPPLQRELSEVKKPSPPLQRELSRGTESSPPLQRELPRVTELPPPLQREPQVERSLVKMPSLSTPMKRLSLTEGGSSRNPERCVVCGVVGHGVNECASLAMW